MQDNVKAAQHNPVLAEIQSLADETVLLERFGGDEEIMRDVVDQFIGMVSEERKDLVVVGNGGEEWDACAQRVHRLASSCSPFGLIKLSRRCIEVESLLRAGDPEPARAGLDEIKFYLVELESTLQRISPP